ncbi:uncharacterized protein E6C27_scaffold979G00580 [Cucumis melo var. makuwa]|nr:uncharacterized protein LOC103503375 isoform X3 [Cucumis melo]KAA0066637.1 uncharacterized protein E6C27_scaffold979G00580 [Cucumis melo var. makuwa]
MVARVHRRSLLVVARSVRGRSQAVVARSVPSAHVRCRSQAAAASSVCAGSSAAAVQKPPLPSAQVKLLHTSDVQKPPRVLQACFVSQKLGNFSKASNQFKELAK